MMVFMSDKISISRTSGIVAIVGALAVGVLYIGEKASATDVQKGIQKVEIRAQKDCLEVKKAFHIQIRQINSKITELRREIRSDLKEFRKDLRLLIRAQK